MIHPMALVFVIIVIMTGLFALVYLAIHLYTRSQGQLLRLEQNRYGTSVEVKTGADYSVRFRPGVNSDTAPTAYLSVSNPPSQSVQVATMSSPSEVTLEIDA